MIRHERHTKTLSLPGLLAAAMSVAVTTSVVMAQSQTQSPESQPAATTQPAEGAATQPESREGGRSSGRRSGRSPATQPQTPATTPAATGTTRVVDLTPPHKPWSHYQVIAQRNMFTRSSAEATRPRPGGSTGENRGGATARPTASWILTGVVIRDEQKVAFFENSLSGMTVRVEAGQSVGDLQVAAIHHDRVEIRSGDTTRSVEIGGTADGRQPTFSSSGGSIFGDADSVAPAASGGSSGGDGNLSEAERRMRERRARERGR